MNMLKEIYISVEGRQSCPFHRIESMRQKIVDYDYERLH